MKTEAVNLRGPTIIDDLTRYPTENPVTVSEAEARSLRERGLLAEDEDDDDSTKKADVAAPRAARAAKQEA